MKKVLIRSLMEMLLVLLFSINVFAAYEAPVRFADVYNYGDKVYTIEFWGTNGGITYKGANTDISNLPENIWDEGSWSNIYSFCCYNDKIYYLKGEDASIVVPASIYSCNMDGSGITILADNASNFSNVYIVDNILYYDAYTTPEWDMDYYNGYYGGIYSINLENLSWQKISDKKYADLWYCDGDYVYYKIGHEGPCYATSTDGTKTLYVSQWCDEFLEDVYVKGNLTYYVKNGDLYVRNKNGWGDRWLAKVPSGQFVSVSSVTDNNIYCTNFVPNYSPSNSDNAGYTYVYEIAK